MNRESPFSPWADEPGTGDDRELILMDRYWEDLRRGTGLVPRAWLEDSGCEPGRLRGRLEVVKLMHDSRHDASAGSDHSGPAEEPASYPPTLPDATRLEGGELCITGLLDAGGMGEVYQAWHETMNRFLAVKLTRDPALQARFRREIEIQNRLGGHPHIVLARTAGRYDGRHYLVMDYIPGVNLRQFVETHGPMPWREAARAIRQAALGLEHAHRRQVVHRDIKPGNLIRSAEDQGVKILDWGLARCLGAATPRDDDDLTASGCLLGTPLYAAPEQLANPAAAGPASDLYSLGCTFYFLLMGRPPFADPRDRRKSPFPLPPELGVPVGVEQVIRTLLRPEPADRYHSAREVVEALDDALTPMPAPARMEPPPRRRTRLALAGAAMTLLLGVIIIILHKDGTTTVIDTEGRPIVVVDHTPLGPGPEPFPSDATLTNSIDMKLTLIPAGEFRMGSPDSDTDAEDPEKPQHRVRITRPFYLGVYEVTRGQFRRFVDETGYQTEAETDGKGGWHCDEATRQFAQNPSWTWRKTVFEQSDDQPVIHVSWKDAVEFATWLSRKEGRTYRLPTEAEWEYACRAGTTTRYSSGDDPETLALVGNVADGTARARFASWIWAITARDGFVNTAPAGQFRPNRFGLCDMQGNVYEWCSDWYDPNYYKTSSVDDPMGPPRGSDRVIRGGSWDSFPKYNRSALRGSLSSRGDWIGFRLALDPTDR